MAATVLMPLLGRHFTSVVVTPQAVDGDGVLTDTTPVLTFTRLKTGLKLDQTKLTEMINDDASINENEVALARSYSGSMSFILENVGTKNPIPLTTAHLVSDYIKFTFVTGTGTRARTVRIYGLIKDVTLDSTGRGNAIESFTFGPVDTGSGADAPITIATS